MLDLTDVLELIVDRIDQGSFPQEDLVDQAEQPELYVLAELADQFDSLSPQEFEELVVEVATIAKALTEEAPCDQQDHASIVNIAQSKTNSQQVVTVTTIRCSLNPKNYPTEIFPILTKPLKTLWDWMRALWQTFTEVESTKLIPLT